MPRPKTKKELLALSQANYKKLIEFVESSGKINGKIEFPKSYLNRNITDVLAHLHHWHLLLLEWHETGLAGEKPDLPSKGYTWKTLPDLNRVIQKKYQNASFIEVRKLLDTSYNTVQELIKKHSEQELFEKKRYKWTGSTSLGSYLTSVTSSHYEWAFKLIKKALKQKEKDLTQE